MWTPDPNLIVKLHAAGAGNMGDVSDRTNATARFRPGVAHVITQLYVRFTGSGDQGVADLAMWLDSQLGGDGIDSIHDRIIEDWENAGFDSASTARKVIDWAPQGGEFHRFVFAADDEHVFVWPDPGATDWAILFAYQPLIGGTQGF